MYNFNLSTVAKREFSNISHTGPLKTQNKIGDQDFNGLKYSCVRLKIIKIMWISREILHALS